MDIGYTYNSPAFPGGIESEPAAIETEKNESTFTTLHLQCNIRKTGGTQEYGTSTVIITIGIPIRKKKSICQNVWYAGCYNAACYYLTT